MRRLSVLFLPFFFFSFIVLKGPFQSSFVQTDKYGTTFKGRIYYDGSKIMMRVEYPDTQYFLMDSISYLMYLPKENTIYQWQKKNYILGIIKGDTAIIKYEKGKKGYYRGFPRITMGIDSFWVWKEKEKIDSMKIFTSDTNIYTFVFVKWRNGEVNPEIMRLPVNRDSVKIIKE